MSEFDIKKMTSVTMEEGFGVNGPRHLDNLSKAGFSVSQETRDKMQRLANCSRSVSGHYKLIAKDGEIIDTVFTPLHEHGNIYFTKNHSTITLVADDVRSGPHHLHRMTEAGYDVTQPIIDAVYTLVTNYGFTKGKYVFNVAEGRVVGVHFHPSVENEVKTQVSENSDTSVEDIIKVCQARIAEQITEAVDQTPSVIPDMTGYGPDILVLFGGWLRNRNIPSYEKVVLHTLQGISATGVQANFKFHVTDDCVTGVTVTPP